MFDKNFTIAGRPDMFDIYYDSDRIDRCYYWDPDCYPFKVYGDMIYIGEEGTTHSSISYDMADFKDSLDRALAVGDYDEYGRIKDIIEWNNICGRIFLYSNIGYSIITFWGANDGSDISSVAMNKLLNKFGLSPDKVLIGSFNGDGFGKFTPYNDWHFSVSAMDDKEKEMYALHLMDAKKKSEKLTPFRQTRDKKIGKKLTDDNGVEMPLAKYYSMIHAENKQYKTIILTENQFNRLTGGK